MVIRSKAIFLSSFFEGYFFGMDIYENASLKALRKGGQLSRVTVRKNSTVLNVDLFNFLVRDESGWDQATMIAREMEIGFLFKASDEKCFVVRVNGYAHAKSEI